MYGFLYLFLLVGTGREQSRNGTEEQGNVKGRGTVIEGRWEVGGMEWSGGVEKAWDFVLSVAGFRA